MQRGWPVPLVQASIPSVLSFQFYMRTFYIRRLENQRLPAFTLQARFPYSTEVNTAH